MRIGARDYILKNQLERLAPGGRARARRGRRAARAAPRRAAPRVPRLSRRADRPAEPAAAAGPAGAGAARRHPRSSSSLALLLLDLNGFKEINDTLGHHAGDRVLQCVASRMRGMLRGADTVARLGGDEFAVVLPATDVDGALLAAQKVLHEIEQPCVIDHHALSVRASLGIACFPDHGRAARDPAGTRRRRDVRREERRHRDRGLRARSRSPRAPRA